MAERELIVRVIGDDRSLQRMMERDQQAVKKAGAELELFGGRFTKLNQLTRGGLSGFGGKSSLLFGSGAFLGSAAITAGVKTAIDAASDLNEQVTKSQQVFGDASRTVLDWSKTTATAIGVSQEAALEAAGTFGNLFASIHLGASQSADVSRRLVQLAADLASFNNADPSEVLQAIRSGLVGEAEPLRRFGVLLSEARVQQLALRESGKDSVKQLTDQEKALARIQIIFQDTTKAQGDFARTSGGLANQQRELSASVQDLEANLGKLLLPSVNAGTAALVDATQAANNLIGVLHDLGKVEIPVIHIPLSLDTGGGGGGPFGFLGNVAKLGPLFELSPALFYTSLTKLIIDQFKGGKAAATADLASQFEALIGGYFQDALNQATQNIPPPEPPTGTPGFATGATPADILGPLIKDIPKKLQEALLDIEIKDPENHKAIIDVLVKEKRSLLDALDDPRLTRDDRIELKKKLQAVMGAIAGEKDAIAAEVETAAQKRTAALEEAKRTQDAAKQKHLEQLQKIQEAREEEARKAAGLLQAHQFRALGLSASGDEIVPGVENLAKRINAALAKVSAGDLDIGAKLASRLKAARKLINTEGDKLTKDTREKINEFIKAINGDDASEALKGPLTKTGVLQANKLLEGFTVSPDFEKALRQRVAAFNNADLAKMFPTSTTTGGGGVIPSMNITVVSVLDGVEVGRSVTRAQQKHARRNPVQKRGPNRNI